MLIGKSVSVLVQVVSNRGLSVFRNHSGESFGISPRASFSNSKTSLCNKLCHRQALDLATLGWYRVARKVTQKEEAEKLEYPRQISWKKH